MALSIVFLKIISRNYFAGAKSDVVGRKEPKFYPTPLAFHGQLMTSAVQVSVKTAAYLIFFQKCQNLGTFIAFVSGRIVKEHKFLLLPRCLQGRFQSEQFPSEYLFIMLTAAFFLKEPSTGSADRKVFIFEAVVVQ